MLRVHSILVFLHILWAFLDDAHFFFLFDFKEHSFCLLDQPVESFNLVLVSVYLWLVVLKFCDHVFKLFTAFLQILLIDFQFLFYFRSWLFSQDILQLYVKFLFLLYKHIFFWNFLGLGDQPFLQRLYLLNQLKSLNVCRLKLSPSVNI